LQIAARVIRAVVRCKGRNMSIQDSRLKKTVQTLWIAIFSYRIGSMEAHTVHTTKYWVLMAVYLVGLICSLYLLLRDVWKPNAAAL
jgi:hypothetical protein